MTDAETRLAEAQERVNAAKLVAVPRAHQSVTCGHCNEELTWDDGFVCTPCDLAFDLDADASYRYTDHEPECAAPASEHDTKFWAETDFTLHPCNLTQGHETAEHHHPMTHHAKLVTVDA